MWMRCAVKAFESARKNSQRNTVTQKEQDHDENSGYDRQGRQESGKV